MKLTSVEIHPEGSSDVAVLSFRDPRATNPYIAKAISGLDADDIISKFYPGSGNSKFLSLSQAKRNVVMRIKLNPDYSELSYSDLRDALYKMIASSRTGKVQLQFKNDATVVAAAVGTISKMEALHFDKDPDVQITVSCDESMLKSPTAEVISVVGLNPALTEIDCGMSTAPHGFKFDATVTAITPSFKITDPDDPTSWSFEIVPAGGFLVGDVLYFSSEINDQYLYMVRAGITVYLADVITPGSVWPILFPGENKFSWTNPANISWSHISHFHSYWGV